MHADELEVYLDEGDDARFVGMLRPSFTGGRVLAGTSFEYSASYLAQAGRYALSPELPLLPGRAYTSENQTLFGAFADAAPDEWGQRIIQANHAARAKHQPGPPRRIGEFDYLCGVSDFTRMGALRLRRPDAGEWLTSDDGVANLHELDRILAAARRYEADEASDDDLAYLDDVATSPGGARPKANLLDADGRLALVKLPHSKDRDVDVEGWEGVALTIAKSSGLSTPDFEVIRVGAEKSVLISRRFDRSEEGQRRGYLSAATALQLGTHDTGSRLTYVDFADVIAELSAQPGDDLREMYARIALTVLVNNVDDHWRNHGFLRVGEGWRLAPVFDVNPRAQGGVISSRPINEHDDPRNRDLRNLRASAAAFALTDAEAGAVIARVAHQVARWPQVAAAAALSEQQQRAMASAFSPEQIKYGCSLGAG